VKRLTQARKATRKNIHCLVLNIASNLNGLGALCIGGLRVLNRVVAYSATVILSGA